MMRFEAFAKGCDVLDPILLPHGFQRTDEYEHQYPSLTGNGEVVVRGAFVRAMGVR
jgi:hypothetical protein